MIMESAGCWTKPT